MRSLSELTARELEILLLVSSGKTNNGIASEICISCKTVEFHLDNIYKKTGARTRMLAVVWAFQRGLLAGPPDQTGGLSG